MNYSEKQLKVLAKENPQELIRIITSPNCDVKMLTLGAEILGEEVSDDSIVIPAIKQLLKHNHALVREGTMNGILTFFANKKIPQDILDRLKTMSTNDPFSANRDLAKDLISTFE